MRICFSSSFLPCAYFVNRRNNSRAMKRSDNAEAGDIDGALMEPARAASLSFSMGEGTPEITGGRREREQF